MQFTDTNRKPAPRAAITLILTFLCLPLAWALSHDRNPGVPVNPVTIPEYDTVAGVIMYWNPGSNHAYNQIVASVVSGIQPEATVFMQTNGQYHQNNMINTFNDYNVPLDNVVFIQVYGDRIWIRDHGPFSIYDNDSLAFVGFNDLAANHGDKDLPERLPSIGTSIITTSPISFLTEETT